MLSSSDTKQWLIYILVYKYHPEITGFNMYAEYMQSQLTFLALLPSMFYDIRGRSIETSFWRIWDEAQIDYI